MTPHSFLVELGTEELPPNQLNDLSKAFVNKISEGLKQANIGFNSDLTGFATPRRLAVLVKDIASKQSDRVVERLGPAVEKAFDENGQPSPAAMGFAKSCGVSIEELERKATDSGERLAYQKHEKGQATESLLADIVQIALRNLPTRKRMRWADHKFEFVRPVHWLVILFDDKVVDTEILGLSANRMTYGHRVHCAETISLETANDYAEILRTKGYVEPSLEKRYENIREQIAVLANSVDGQIIDDGLLHEVTALVEWPQALLGQFEDRFLAIPKEAIIAVLQKHQRYFPIQDLQRNLMPYFVIVSNIASTDEQQVISGNEKVIRPRLADAEFFFTNDKKISLSERALQLKNVIYQAKLGTLEDKTKRLVKLAAVVTKQIAEQINVEVKQAERAANLAKADLLTEMVQEFPELQGIMGAYYAQHDGEDQAVVDAIREHYMPLAGHDQLPESLIGCALAIADKLDQIVGLFLIGKTPTGDKDPFGLRRAALGIVRIIQEKNLRSCDLMACIEFAIEQYDSLSSSAEIKNSAINNEIFDFILDRWRGFYTQFSADTFNSVRACVPTKPWEYYQRLLAVHSFRNLPEAEALAAANKRVSNILAKQNDANIEYQIISELLQDEHEIKLHESLVGVDSEVNGLIENYNYEAALKCLATLREPIDGFFDNVLVMVEDAKLKNNRLALLAKLRHLFLQIADISLLQTN